MLELINKTPFKVNFTPLTNLDGFDALAVFMTSSLVLEQGKWRLCEAQIQAPFNDKYWDEDQASSIKYPSQLSLNKPATDVIVNAVAISPNQRETQALEASVELGGHRVAVHVYGDRVWQQGSASRPQPFQRMPIIWENAFGGRELVGDTEHAYEHNPLGKGWRVDKTAEAAYHGISLPNIEWPDQLLRSPQQRPMPAGFGAQALDTPGRAQYAGTYDELWKAQQAPFMPKDFNPAFFNAAIPALQIKNGLQGGEAVRLINLNEMTELTFTLPVLRPKGEVFLTKGRHPLEFKLLTVLIESETATVRMFWQAMAPIHRTLADIKAMKVVLARS